MSKDVESNNDRTSSPWGRLAILLATVIFLSGTVIGVLGYFLGITELMSMGITLFITGSIPILIDRVFTRSLIKDIVKTTTETEHKALIMKEKEDIEKIANNSVDKIAEGVGRTITTLSEVVRGTCEAGFKKEIDSRIGILTDIADDALEAVRSSRRTSIVASPEGIYRRFQGIMLGCITDGCKTDGELNSISISGAGADLDDPLYREPIMRHIHDLCHALKNGINIQRIQTEECPITWLVVLSHLQKFENFHLCFTSEKEIIAPQLFLYESKDAIIIPREDILRDDSFGIYIAHEPTIKILQGHFSSKFNHLCLSKHKTVDISKKIDALYKKRVRFFRKFLAERYLRSAIHTPHMMRQVDLLKSYWNADPTSQLDEASRFKEYLKGELGGKLGEPEVVENIINIDVRIIAEVLKSTKDVISIVCSTTKTPAEKKVAVDNWLKAPLPRKTTDDFSSVNGWLSKISKT